MNLSGIGGAGTVDTTGGNISSRATLRPGGLTKIGPGNLMLSGINTLGGNLIVDGGTLQVPGGGLAPANQYIGYSATGSFAQSGGTNSVSGSLYIGNNSGSSGSCSLSGSGLLSATTEVIGFSGSGGFTQSGGTHLVGGLLLADNASSTGSYNLNGGSLRVAGLAQAPAVRRLTSAAARWVLSPPGPRP